MHVLLLAQLLDVLDLLVGPAHCAQVIDGDGPDAQILGKVQQHLLLVDLLAGEPLLQLPDEKLDRLALLRNLRHRRHVGGLTLELGHVHVRLRVVYAIGAARGDALTHVLLALEPGLVFLDDTDRFSRQLLREKGAQTSGVRVVLLAVHDEVEVDDVQEFFLEEVDLLEVHAADPRDVAILVEGVGVELVRDEDRH